MCYDETSPLPQILHNLCFSFLLGITAVPRESENNAYAKFCFAGGGGGGGGLGANRNIMRNVEVAYWFKNLKAVDKLK